MKTLFSKIADLYIDGFKSMTVGKKLWILIIVKLIIIFAILKVFFFPDFLNSTCKDDVEKAAKVRKEITDKNRNYKTTLINNHLITHAI